MKKHLILATIFSIILVFFITGCSNKEKSEAAQNSETGNKVSMQTEKETDSRSEETTAIMQTEAEATEYPITIKDKDGNEIVIEKEPKRVISLGPNMTEIIFSLGKGGDLVGRTSYCDYPESAQNAVEVGSLREINFETIASLEPDLVMASTHFTEENAAKFKELGIQVLTLYAEQSFEGVYDMIYKAGEALNAKQKAQEVVSQMQEKVSNVNAALEGKEKPTVYYVVGYGEYGDYTATGETFISKIIEMAGGDNIAKDAEGWKYNIESVVDRNPQIVICPSSNDAKVALEKATGYKDLDAVINGRLFEINEDLINRQGPRLVDGLIEMAKIIHPEVEIEK